MTSSPPRIISPSTSPASTSSSAAFVPLVFPLLLSISLLPQSLLLRLHLLRRFLNLHRRLRQILWESRVRALLALPSIRAKAGKVELAQRLPHMLFATSLTQGAKSPLVMRTRRQSRCRIDVQVIAVLATDTVATAIVVRTLRSSPDVVFMQVIALVTFLAETLQPVLTDEVVVVMVAVLIRTEIA